MNENNNHIDPEEILNEETVELPEVQENVVEEALAESAEEYVVEAPAAEDDEPVEKKKNGKKIAITIAAVIVGLAAVLAIVAAILMNSPMVIIGRGAKNTYDSLKNNEIVDLFTDVADGGSIGASVDLEELTDSMMGYGIEGAANVKLYSGSISNPAFGFVGDLELDGDDILDLTLVLNEDEVALASSLLGDDAYGINFKKIVENFEDSVFGPDGDYSIGLEVEDLEEMLSNVETGGAAAKDAEAIAKDLCAELVKSLKKNCEFDKAKETLSFGDVDCKTTAVTVSLDAVGLVNIANDILTYLSTDGKLQDYLYENAETLVAVAPYLDMYSVADLDGDELVDAFYETIDEGLEAMEDAMEEAEDVDFDVDVVFYVSKSGSYLVGIEFNGKMDGDKVKAEVFAGPSLEDLSEISFRMDDGYTKLKGSYTVKTNDKKEYKANLSIKEDNETVLSGSVDWDKKKGDLDVEFTDSWGDEYLIEAGLNTSSKGAAIELKSIELPYDSYDLGINLELTRSDKMPSVSKYIDVLTMDIEDIEDVAYEVMEVVEELSYMM